MFSFLCFAVSETVWESKEETSNQVRHLLLHLFFFAGFCFSVSHKHNALRLRSTQPTRTNKHIDKSNETLHSSLQFPLPWNVDDHLPFPLSVFGAVRQLIFVALQLLYEARVGRGGGPSWLDQGQSSVKGVVLTGHEEGDDHGGRSRYAGIAVDQHHSFLGRKDEQR